MSVIREDYRYGACGVPHVVLRDLEIRRCPCEEVEVVIPGIARLHRALADAVKGQGALTPSEVEFLRRVGGIDAPRDEKPWWTPPPHENAEAHEKVMTRLETMSREELIAAGVRAGIRTPDGQLTAPYRSDTKDE